MPALSAGIDVGVRSIKVVIVDDTRVIARASRRTGVALRESIDEVFAAALTLAGVQAIDPSRVVATGTGREEARQAGRRVTELTSAARAAVVCVEGVRTVLDVGAEEARALRLGPDGRMLDFVVNDKCAAGAGAFAETIARALEVRLEELGPLSQRSTTSLPVNAHCVVFAESEVVSMIHSNVAPADIAHAVHEAVAARVCALLRRLDSADPTLLVGGLARNSGFVASISRAKGGTPLVVPEHAEFAVALGAALLAAQPGA